MSISIFKLLVSGSSKEDAIIDIQGKSHLVFGPTDTGKSYIVECLRYCLGGSSRPRNVGHSEGYSRIALQISTSEGKYFTLFRNLIDGEEAVYEGHHDCPPLQLSVLPTTIGELLATNSNVIGKKILVKTGKLGNFTPHHLRYLSLFDEIETLDKVSLEGSDTTFQMQYKSSIALVISGSDDSQAILAPTTDQRNLAKGHLEAIEEEIKIITERVNGSIPLQASKEKLKKLFDDTVVELEKISMYLNDNIGEITLLKKTHAEIEKHKRETMLNLTGLIEAKDRFILLDLKYENDLQRLQALTSAVSVVSSFETRPCPLCKTDLTHQLDHQIEGEDRIALQKAASVEAWKIVNLRKGLSQAVDDIGEDILAHQKTIQQIQLDESENIQQQTILITPAIPSQATNLVELAEKKSLFSLKISDLDRLEYLQSRLSEFKKRTKRQKQSVERDITQSANSLCTRVSRLLVDWGVPEVKSVYYDESKADLCINNRERISYGKGKRGIFLTAYVIALMEQALKIKSPHLGFVVIDSPVVTYKDPKHGSSDKEEALDIAVKDQFYAWLANRQEDGQVIVLENEEPLNELKGKISFTEFVGVGQIAGRSGFFPA